MAKLSRDKKIVSITLSKEVVEILNVFKNKSKLVDDILSSLLLNLSQAEVFELIMNNDDNVAMFLIRKKCKELEHGKLAGGTEEVKTQQVDKKSNNYNINLQDFWG